MPGPRCGDHRAGLARLACLCLPATCLFVLVRPFARSLSLSSHDSAVTSIVCGPGMQCNAFQKVHAMYRVAVVSRWRGLCKHKPFDPIAACHTFDLAAGGLRNPRSPSACSSTAVVTDCRSVLHLCQCPHPRPRPGPRPAPPRLASPRVSPGAMVQCCSPTIAHRPPPAPSSVRWASPHSPPYPDEPLRKGAPPGQCPPSLLRHPNLDACLSCLCRIPITDRPMRLANHGPCPSLADASPEYQVFPVLSLILILLMLLAACSLLLVRAVRRGLLRDGPQYLGFPH